VAVVDSSLVFPLTAFFLSSGLAIIGTLGFLNVARKDGRDDLQREVERWKKRADYLTEANAYLEGRVARLERTNDELTQEVDRLRR